MERHIVRRVVIGTVAILAMNALVIEAFSFAASKLRLLAFNDPPSAFSENRHVSVWRSERDAWGAWHLPNVVTVVDSTCYGVTYETNQYGARDEPFSRDARGRRRVVLLGDSFAEGYAVNLEDTAQRHLEKDAGIEVLNFGSAAHFGPVQYFLLYQGLARSFDHDAVIVFFLPANDFTDNDYQFWRANGLIYRTAAPLDFHYDDVAPSVERYRPYWRRTDGRFEVFYPPAAVPDDRESHRGVDNEQARGKFSAAKGFADEFLWSKNIYRTARFVVERYRWERAFSRSGVPLSEYSGYFDASIEQQEAALFFLQELTAAASPRPTYIVTIPDQRDIARIRAGDDPGSQYWYQELMKMDRLPHVTVLDLAQYLPSDSNSLFHPCDGHWSAKGNEWAASVMVRQLPELNHPPSTAAR
jgi:hypothetical protein